MFYKNKEKKILLLALLDTNSTKRQRDYSLRERKILKRFLNGKSFLAASRKEEEVLRYTLIDTLVNSETHFSLFETQLMTDLYHKIGKKHKRADWRKYK